MSYISFKNALLSQNTLAAPFIRNSNLPKLFYPTTYFTNLFFKNEKDQIVQFGSDRELSEPIWT